MKKGRRQHSAEIKAKVALMAIQGERTANEIGKMNEVHPLMVTKWKKQALEELPQVLRNRRNPDGRAQEDLTAALYQQIGQLKVELDWLKKKASSWE